MKRLLLLLVLLLLACGSAQTQAVTADAVARVVNVSIDSLAEVYEAEGDRAIDEAKTVPELLMVIPNMQSRWAPVWAALRVFAAVHDAWATALERGEEGDVEAVRAAFCEWRKLATDMGGDIPTFPILSCP